MPRHPEDSKFQGFTQTPDEPRTRPLDNFTFQPPARWTDVQTYMFHLSRDHGLKFDRGEEAVRLYNSAEVREARADCEETCGAGKETAHQKDLLAVIQEGKKTKKKKQTKASTSTPVVRRPNPKPILGTSAAPVGEPGFNRSKTNSHAVAKKLVTAWHICARFNKLGADDSLNGTFVSRLKRNGLQVSERCGQASLYSPQQVDEVARKLGFSQPTTDWPEGITVKPWDELPAPPDKAPAGRAVRTTALRLKGPERGIQMAKEHGMVTSRQIASMYGRDPNDQPGVRNFLTRLRKNGLVEAYSSHRTYLYDHAKVEKVAAKLGIAAVGKWPEWIKAPVAEPKLGQHEGALATAKAEGLVTSMDIGGRYGKATATDRNNFVTRLKQHGLSHTKKVGNIMLYDPRDVDQACAKRSVEATGEWPEWVKDAEEPISS